jgi:rhodanese-related sulfurtransferase
VKSRQEKTFLDELTRCVPLLALAAALACTAGAEPDEITPQDLLARNDAPLVLDVRSPEEFASGHVPGARNVSYDQVTARLAELRPAREVVVYCERGPRASKAAAVLNDAGFTVRHLAGDMRGWREAGLPIER